jgi:MFS family permease
MNDSADAASEWRNYWTLPIAAALGYSTAVIHVYGIGPFMTPIAQEFGWSRATLSAGITIAGVTGAAFSVLVGLLVDRLGPRLVGLIGVPLMMAAFAMLGTATGEKTNWFALWGFIAFANLWLQATVWTGAVATRFESSRGLAFAVTLSGASVAATAYPILATWLIGTHGWRDAFMWMAGIWGALVFPVMLLFFRGARDSRQPQLSAATASIAIPGVSVSEGLRMGAFYKLLAASGLFTFTAIGIMVHFVPILTDHGADPLAAAGIASLIGIFSIIGRLGAGVLLDRLPGHKVGAGVFLLPIAACVLLLDDGSSPLNQSVAAACFGLTVGAEVDVIAYLTSRYFSLKNYGVLLGAMVGALALGAAFGPLAAGAAFDHYGGYPEFLVLTIACMAISGIALATLGLPRFGTKIH